MNIPSKLLPFILKLNDFRYFLGKGGRGGGKSHSVGRIILYLGEKRKIRVVCGRETQNTIGESVYSLLADLIRTFKLNYEIQANKLIHRVTGTEITFRGFRQQGAFNIQGMEGIDILWIDEAQALTKQTIDVLIPTIRKDNAKVFFTMNPHVVDDPVVVFLQGRQDCYTTHVNYDENPFCTDALKKEAHECRAKSEEDYQHIWLGKPLEMSEDAVFSYEELEKSIENKRIPLVSYGLRLAGHDVARYGDDKCATVILQQQAALAWEDIFIDEWGHKDLNYTTGRILTHHTSQEVEQSIIDEDGIGSGPLDTLQKGRNLETFFGFRNPNYSYKENRDYANPRTANAFKTRDMIRAGHLVINNHELRKELCTLRYTYDHLQRKVLISKEKMRKDGVKSPNKADALLMAVSLIENIEAKQARQYQPQVRGVAPEENLFEIAGIK